MQARYSSLLAAALVLVVLPSQTARSQGSDLDFCFVVEGQPFVIGGTIDRDTDLIDGTADGGDAFTWLVSGGRGSVGRTLRHHVFALMNPQASDDPGCDDGAGAVDWVSYNGRIIGGSAPTYAWRGFFRNSCGATGLRDGTLTLGDCPVPRPAASGGSDLAAPKAETRGVGPVSSDAEAPLVVASPEGGLTYCYTNTGGFQHEGTFDPSTYTLYGTGTVTGTDEWFVTGGRGAVGTELRHHVFTWQNPDADDNPGCTSDGVTADWFSYNGLASRAGESYSYNAVWLNSCGATGARNGTITIGACSSPGPGASGAGLEARVPPEAASPASASGSGERTAGVALTSSPNPFAGSTMIAYALAEASDVRLVVYDVLGREVALLVDEAKEAGVHAVPFDGASLPAGTYVYRLEAGQHTEVQQMTLVR